MLSSSAMRIRIVVCAKGIAGTAIRPARRSPGVVVCSHGSNVALKLRAPIGLAKTPVFLYSVCSSAPDRKKSQGHAPDAVHHSKGRFMEDSKKGPGGMSAEKSKALAVALAQIEKQFGKGSIMRLGAGEAIEDIQVVSTGSLGLDIALGVGGLPRGRVVEIYGPESSG